MFKSRRLKRFTDIVGSLTGLATLGPVLVPLTGAGWIIHGWPPFLVQVRPGYKGRLFKLINNCRNLAPGRAQLAAQLLPSPIVADAPGN